MEHKIALSFDNKSLDENIKKANQLVELLQKAQQIINSLSKTTKLKT